MAFNFAFLFCPWKASAFAERVEQWEALLGSETWPNYTLNNHDWPRSFSRYGRGIHATGKAKVAAAMLLMLRGTPFIYYGEEIGMGDGTIPRSRIQDPLGKRYWPFFPGRDPVRTPMQWDDTPNSGFSTNVPWLPVNEAFQRKNTAVQIEDPNSLFNWYRSLIRLRKDETAVRRGDYRRLWVRDDVYCFERRWGRERIVVALNFSANDREIPLPDPDRWIALLGEASAMKRGAGPSGPSSQALLSKHGVLIAKSLA